MSTTTETTAKARPTMAADDFTVIQEFVLRHSGIQLDQGQEYLVDSRLSPVARRFELEGVAGVVDQLRGSGTLELKRAVIDAMTTNETSFFRDQHPFEALMQQVIPGLLERRGPLDPLTIWCAASSSGQEVYSLAMTLCESFPELVARNRVRIIATDLSPTMVARTKEGRYSQFEINRGLRAPLLVTYFEQERRDWVARDQLRSMIDARELNLLAQWRDIPRCDIVLMRNVLIYFSLETKQKLLERVRSDALRPDGYLFLGASETTINIDAAYVKETHGRAVYYRPQGG
jgi:chemotaxis protein methyltransferase CheR